MGTTLSGLVSGFDWTSMIDKLIAVARVPQDRLNAEKVSLTAKNSALESLRTQFASLQTSAQALGSSSLFGLRSANFGGSSGWSATAGSGAAMGDYKFTVSQLATTGKIEGAANRGEGLIVSPATAANTVIASMNLAQSITTGEFTVNGVKISVATTDTLQDVFDRLSSQAGVTADYDAASDTITLSSASAITLGAVNDTSNFLNALKLYGNGTTDISSASSLGVVRTTVSMGQSRLASSITAVDGSGAGSFTINGVDIAYNVNSDSIRNVLDRINASGAGVTATYDAAQDRFRLTNQSTGDLGISVSESAGGFLGALGLTGGSETVVAGKNALFSVNDGSTITSRSNTLDAAAHGITGLSVTVRGTGADTVTIGADSTSARAAIDDFVSKYNALQTAVDSMTKITTTGTTVTLATLGGNRDVSEMARALRATLFESVSGNAGTIKRLADLGIDFSGTSSTLTVKDSAALDTMLAEKGADVAAYFSDSANGLGKRLDELLDLQLGDGGSFAAQTENIARQQKSLTQQIDAIERRLEAQREALEASFIQMENIQATLQAQAQTLTNAFSDNSDS